MAALNPTKAFLSFFLSFFWQIIFQHFILMLKMEILAIFKAGTRETINKHCETPKNILQSI
jgi:hypothetical protein